MPCGWEGNCRSGVALATRDVQWFLWFIHLYGLTAQGDEHPAYTPHGVWHTLPYVCVIVLVCSVSGNRTAGALSVGGQCK